MIVQVVPRLRLSALYVVNAVTPDVPRGSALMCSSDVIPWAALIVQGVPETKQQPVRLAVAEPPPLEVGNASIFCTEAQAVVGSTEHLDDVAIVADVARPPVDHAPGAPEETHPVTGGDREIIGPSVLVDGAVDNLVITDFAAALQPLADCSADLGDVVVGRRADRDSVLRAARS